MKKNLLLFTAVPVYIKYFNFLDRLIGVAIFNILGNILKPDGLKGPGCGCGSRKMLPIRPDPDLKHFWNFTHLEDRLFGKHFSHHRAQ
jgi:hypothetical protein